MVGGPEVFHRSQDGGNKDNKDNKEERGDATVGLFGGDFRVVKVGLFGVEETVLDNVDLDDAEKFVRDHSGFFGDHETYKINRR